MRKETAARVLAIQALYQRDLRGGVFMDELDAFFEASAKGEEVIGMARELVHGCVEAQDELDARIAQVAEHWDVSRMAAVDRAIMRLGAYELLHKPDVPPKVAVDEAIRLAKRFSTADSGAFVNGILDKIMSPSARTRSNPERTQ